MLTSTVPRLKPAFAICISALCLWMVSQQVSEVSWADLSTAVSSIHLWQWAIAAVATFASFLAIGQYDVIWHRHLGSNVTPATARKTGMATVAVAQTVGLGSVTGTFLRWHMLHPIAFSTATAITIGVCLSFLGFWAVFAVLAAGWMGFVGGALTQSLIVLAACLSFALFKQPRFRAIAKLMPALCGLTFLDLFFAALALWVLFPDPTVVSFPTLLAGFTIALGAGLISNAPGGLGAFELVMLTVLATAPEATLCATILAFRVVYYLVPALCGGAILLYAHLRGKTDDTQVSQAPISDLCRQGAILKSTRLGRVVMRRHLLGTVSIEPTTWDFMNDTQHIGFLGIYKAPAAVATIARRHGWTVRRVAVDAVITPLTWTTEGSNRSQLRRKLRQATKARITVVRNGRTAPSAEMDAVAKAWADAHGGELGYAMGRYDPAYVRHQQTYLIYQDDQLCGFVTVQARAQAWAIDLIRHIPRMPQGAMHAAITRIIEDASVAGVATLSLGAVPDGPADNTLQAICIGKKTGLRQFKAAFGPRWEPRYHIAPTSTQWAISLIHVFWHVQRPLVRLWSRLPGTLAELMKMERIIHLIHIKEPGNSTSIPAKREA